MTNYIIVVFCHGDDPKLDNKTIEDFISEAEPDLQDMIRTCKRRYHVFHNRSDDCTQVDEFMKQINEMLSENNHTFFSHALFTMAQALKESKISEEDMKNKIMTPRPTKNNCSIQ